jgi:putative transposase
MKYRLSKGAHSVHALQYHFVQCVKYRRDALVEPDIVAFLKGKIHKISETFDVEVLNVQADTDHFHMLFKAKPTLRISRYINTLKTLTSREIKRNFPDVKDVLRKDAFWSGSYFLATTGQVTLDMLNNYIENHEEKRRKVPHVENQTALSVQKMQKKECINHDTIPETHRGLLDF